MNDSSTGHNLCQPYCQVHIIALDTDLSLLPVQKYILFCLCEQVWLMCPLLDVSYLLGNQYL